jgi:4-carboxymuconolactone decarboxylase
MDSPLLIIAECALKDLIRFRGGRSAGSDLASDTVNSAEDLLRRLALNDERVLGMVLTRRAEADGNTELNPKTELLVRLAALLAVGAATPSLREAVDQATAAGATPSELVAVLVAVGPAIGLASLVACAPRLAMAIGYDLENGHVSALSSEADERRGS